ncbi:MAG: hypothetical protein HGA96_04380 [Desulfobulbaceae bacterium]|nr:hypothetical protein [Desulfobulbaceae bacterium]
MRGTISNPGKPSQMPLFLAVALHLGAFLLALLAPHLVPEKIRLPTVYRVELYKTIESPPPAPLAPPVAAMAETPPSPLPPPSPPAPHVAAPKTKPLPTPAAKPNAKPLAKPEAVSLSPLKERLLRENQERQEKTAKKRQLAGIAEQLQLEQEKRLADEQAKEATRKAREAIAATYRASLPRTPLLQDNIVSKPRNEKIDSGAPAAPPSNTPSPSQKKAEAAYSAKVKAHIEHYWSLPSLQDWDEKLSATYIISIKRDGSPSKPPAADKESGNARFEKQVLRTIADALPLPPLPPELGKNSEDIGVTFTPRGIK